MSDVAITRTEQYLNGIAEGESVDIKPVTRKELFLAKAAGMDVETPDPVTREEMYLSKISGSSSGGDEKSQLDSLIDGSITEVTSNAEIVAKYAFFGCENLITAKFNRASELAENALYACNKLVDLYIPEVTYMGNYALDRCTVLPVVDAPKLQTIQNASFEYCTSLTAIILRSEKTTTLKNKNAFTGTPIASGTGYIYVPADLVDTYKAATNWSTYADQFRALEDYTVDGTITGELDESKI